MKRLLIILLSMLLVVGVGDAQAQTKKTSGKAKTTKTTKNQKGKKGKKDNKPTKPAIEEVQLPYNSNDCLFAIPLQPDVPFGPTTGPRGGGRMMEVMADAAHPNMFDYEHNSVWYKFTVPYNGDLEIAITQTNPQEDYDFLVYRYTNDYFSNNVMQNKVLPVAVNLSSVDSATAAQSAVPKGKGSSKVAGATIGMSIDATDVMTTKKSKAPFIKSIPVHKDEVYYIVLDNRAGAGDGHTIKVSIHVDAFTPTVMFYDPVARKHVEVDLLVLEKNTNNREVVKNPTFKGGKLKFVPHFNYTLYAKKPGYFSIYKDFNSDIFMIDTMMRFIMNRTEKGTVFPINDIYFEEGESKLLPESDTALLNYIAMFRNHPDVTFLVKGYVPTYGTDIEHDQQVSLARAQSVKDFFVRNGIEEQRITVAGMTATEIKRAASAVLDHHKTFRDIKVELIITGIYGK